MYLIRKFLKLWYRIYDPSLRPASLGEQRLIDELRQTIRALSSVIPGGSSGVEDFWLERRRQIRELVRREDPRNFLRWEPIVGTMYVGDAKNICQELDHLKKSSKWNSRWKALTNESPVGHPRPSTLFPGRSGNVIHHAYHLCRLEEEAGIDVGGFDRIVELGGVRKSLQTGISTRVQGKIYHCDLPELCALQTFYLQSANIPICSIDSPQASCVSTVSDIQSLIRHFPALRGEAAFLATWSMSETSLGVRQALMPLLSMCEVVLIGSQERFCDIDNVEFFANLQRISSDSYKWTDEVIPHLPGNRYLFGVKAMQNG